MKRLVEISFKLLLVFFYLPLLAQDCDLPIITKFTEFSSEGVRIHWLDSNPNANSWEIELGLFGFDRDFQPTTNSIIEQEYLYLGLEPGVRYECYIRSNCINADSDWNGPYFFNTSISLDVPCPLDLPINDNNCPSRDEYFIEVVFPNNPILGSDIFLEAVDVVIEHPWTPDLNIKLISPANAQIELFANRGIHNSNLGIPGDSSCLNFLRFTDIACNILNQTEGPYLGEFSPEEPLALLNNNGGSASGQWIVSICDRAYGDIGKIVKIDLVFSDILCESPSAIMITDIEGSEATLSWLDNESCNDVKLTYGLLGFQPNEARIDFVECDKNAFTFTNLDPGTEYELYFETICSNELKTENCPIFFTTACANSSLTSSFDEFEICVPNCNRKCVIADSVWHNAPENQIDWILYTGPSPSSFTGPKSDINLTGNYIYLESQPEACGTSYTSSFETNCLTIGSAGMDCGMSFYYHMFGMDIDILRLQINVDENDNWVTLWEKEGPQSDTWILHYIDLSDYENTSSRLRFLANSNGGNLGDIAIDQIKFYGSLINQSLFSFYVDGDQDSFGDPNSKILVCQSTAPQGFVDNSFDCDDDDHEINPDAIEFPCNLVDENCNGLIDDEEGNQIEYFINNVASANCSGINTGKIDLTAFGGTGSYKYLWNNGDTEPIISGLEPGLYQCTISDLIGCKVVTEQIFVGAIITLSSAILKSSNPSCAGHADGVIEIGVGGGIEPYEVAWNNGTDALINSDLSEGSYYATITDFFGCSIQTDTFILVSDPEVIPGILFNRPVSCFGFNDGSLSANVTGGRPPYKFVWNSGDTTSFIGNLDAGSYSLTVEDNSGCIGELLGILVEEADPIEIILDGIEPIECFGEENGSIEITVKGGNPPYAYFWSDNNFNSDRLNIAAGVYNLTVTDSKSCETILQNIQVKSSTEIEISIDSLSNVSCPATLEGYVSVIIEGGTPPYLYSWNNGSQESYIDNLEDGFYSLTVVDQFQCKSLLNNIEIQNLNQGVNLDAQLLTDILCYGDSTASIRVTSLSGQAPFDFNWSLGIKEIKNSNSDTISNLSAGSYSVTVTDALGCVSQISGISTSDPEKLVYDAEIEQSECYDSQDAFINLTINGGKPVYNIDWNNNLNGEEISKLIDGDYIATITDQNDCVLISQVIEIKSPDSIRVEASVFGNGPNGLGSIILIVDGGTPPYLYDWEGPDQNYQDSVLLNLNTGDYMLNLSDNNGCSLTASYFIDNLTSNNVIELDQLEIYPNPTNGILRVRTNFSSIIDETSILSTEGMVIHIIEEQATTSINLSDLQLEAGIYFIAFQFEGGKRVVKQFVYLGGS